ncbi:MFS transporter [Treponema sp. HNW]|uniref:MFS transporter n=1 Tax=Treponema sp. HNW TaxID=3116654 RepID=UPI003D098702
MTMIRRFSLYGFLKNFDFSEPFIILFYLSLGLSYVQIGVLTAFLHIVINITEIPSGAFADLYGKKTAMLVSLSSYIAAFAFFSLARSFALLIPAVFFYAVGDSFRTGTHKAIIFDWLKMQDRLDEKTRVYGYTRSWSNYGSAFSVIIAAFIVAFTDNYRFVFVFSLIPAVVGLWNMFRYPDELNCCSQNRPGLGEVFRHSVQTVKSAFTDKDIRHLIIQNTGFEGCFNVSKDFLQPLLKAQAALAAAAFSVSDKNALALIVASVYFVLYILSALSSRKSHSVASLFKSEKSALIFLLFISAALLNLSCFAVYFKLFYLAIGVFMLLFIVKNIWVPINIAQYDNYSTSSDQATILSIASQAKAVGISVLAPLAGLCADRFGIYAALLFLSIVLGATAVYSLYRR